MAGALQDITDRKRAEERLRLSEERLRMALTASDLGIWDWDVLSNRLYWSDGVEALFGLAAGTFSGTYAAYIARIYPLDRGLTLWRALSSACTTRPPSTSNIAWCGPMAHYIGWHGRDEFIGMPTEPRHACSASFTTRWGALTNNQTAFGDLTRGRLIRRGRRP